MYFKQYILDNRVLGVVFRTLNRSGYLSDGLCQWRIQGGGTIPHPMLKFLFATFC